MKKAGSVIFILIAITAFGQSKIKDKVRFKEYDFSKSFYYTSILKDVQDQEDKKAGEKKARTILSVDFTGKSFPTKIDEYKTVWHGKPVSQGNAGTCWCFSATSFFESEVKRISGKEVKLSEIYTVYWEYVERARDYVKTRGETYFAEGSEAAFAGIIYEKYGIVPEKDYSGKLNGRKHHSHREMVEEMTKYLEKVKENGAWNEEEVVKTIKSILDYHIGTPPTEITVDGKKMTPLQYLNDVLSLKIGDYYSFMSIKNAKYDQKSELIEADNWRHYDDYYNVSLDDYMTLIKEAVDKGFSISICGDISEPGHDSEFEVAVIPSYDIPSEYINEDSRMYRLENKTTTDDHCIHLVGYKVVDGIYWFLMKDSGAGAFDGPNKGYYFFHEDFIKLKMMNILIHKDAARKVLDKIIK
ncbi:MAG: hypothetical protein A2W91_20365 [Bacteroidetes bacterium GWF2_38_335]|nr:MAG: hypothetical protein A2W91_20365 [Bacteroidetes bacterium GWF2_38_335]OFY79485.1 MAG: hypothetical protein A2281_13720 [Bacteroidetes bacterium RIFOXYA12_FULL_38_20]HBS86577.1 peptidase C1 [Bacteroidales bacterium]